MKLRFGDGTLHCPELFIPQATAELAACTGATIGNKHAAVKNMNRDMILSFRMRSRRVVANAATSLKMRAAKLCEDNISVSHCLGVL